MSVEQNWYYEHGHYFKSLEDAIEYWHTNVRTEPNIVFEDDDGRTVVIDSVYYACTQRGDGYLYDRPCGVWFCQISPTYCILFGSLGCFDADIEDALGALVAAGYPELDDSEHLHDMMQEYIDEGCSEEEAYEKAYEGAIPINGGASWILGDDVGRWKPSKATIDKARALALPWLE